MRDDIQYDLIFDLGLHKGFDSEFYLSKGFRVVAVEALTDLCEQSAQLLRSFGDRLKIVNKALSERSGERVAFYRVPDKDDWGSLYKEIAEKGIEQSSTGFWLTDPN